jgi:hypothetical protein
MADPEQPADLARGQPAQKSSWQPSSELTPNSLARRREEAARRSRKQSRKENVERQQDKAAQEGYFWLNSIQVAPTGNIDYRTVGAFATEANAHLYKQMVFGLLHLFLGGSDSRIQRECELQLLHWPWCVRL